MWPDIRWMEMSPKIVVDNKISGKQHYRLLTIEIREQWGL
jgi:hypothetical protein